MKNRIPTAELGLYVIFLLITSVLFAFTIKFGTTGTVWYGNVNVKIGMTIATTAVAGILMGEILYRKIGKK